MSRVSLLSESVFKKGYMLRPRRYWRNEYEELGKRELIRKGTKGRWSQERMVKNSEMGEWQPITMLCSQILTNDVEKALQAAALVSRETYQRT
ncbi:MAG: hypothetical protein Q9215_002704 [Flavoplaca cf. flavocitrina]